MRNHPSQRVMIKCLTINQIELEFGNICWFLRRGENGSTWRKTSQSKEENQKQTQSTYDTGSGNETHDTFVGGEHSHHCAILAPQSTYIVRVQPLLNIRSVVNT